MDLGMNCVHRSIKRKGRLPLNLYLLNAYPESVDKTKTIHTVDIPTIKLFLKYVEKPTFVQAVTKFSIVGDAGIYPSGRLIMSPSCLNAVLIVQ